VRMHTLDDLVGCLKGSAYKIRGTAEGKIFTTLKSIAEADEESLIWVSPQRKDGQHLVEQTRARFVICDASIRITDELASKKCFIVVENPKLAVIRVLEGLFAPAPQWGIHPTSVVHPEAEIDPEVALGPFCHIGKCSILKGTRIDSFVHINDNVRIGKNVRIHSGVIIGASSFNYTQDEEGEYVLFPHLGGVIIEKDVEIGPNSCIFAGGLGNTLIAEGTKISNMVCIASNVKLGDHCQVRVGARILGSAIIGRRSIIGPSAMVRDGIQVGEGCFLGMGTVVLNEIPPNKVVVGIPGRILRDHIPERAQTDDEGGRASFSQA
jgi:UDP-3-O-[3-hydroxymyristoyl] glucosamine N-acyltransferase